MQLLYHNINLLHYLPFNEALELLDTLHSFKPVSRFVVHESALSGLTKVCVQLGLAVVHSDVKYHEETNNAISLDSPVKGNILLYVGKDKDDCLEAKEAEGRNDSQFGSLLGYPSCCVRFYVQEYNKAKHVRDDYTLLSVKNTKGIRASFLLNNIIRYTGLSLISHFPCSYHCQSSMHTAARRLALLKKYSPGLVRMTEDGLKGIAITHLGSGVHFLPSPLEVDDDVFVYTEVVRTQDNPFHTLLTRANKIKIMNNQCFSLYDRELLRGVVGEDAGVLVFE